MSAVLHVCTTCRQGRDPAAGETTRGTELHEAILALDPPEGRIRPVTCLANCARGCAAALTGSGKWSTLLGGLDPCHAADLVAYLHLYEASASGSVLPSKRPPSLRDVVIGRIPG